MRSLLKTLQKQGAKGRKASSAYCQSKTKTRARLKQNRRLGRQALAEKQVMGCHVAESCGSAPHPAHADAHGFLKPRRGGKELPLLLHMSAEDDAWDTIPKRRTRPNRPTAGPSPCPCHDAGLALQGSPELCPGNDQTKTLKGL